MPGFSSNIEHKNAATRISREIHRQIHDSVIIDEAVSCSRVASLFTVGYLYGIIRQGFTNQGFQGEQLTEKYFKPVCKDIPGNFYKVIREQCLMLDRARELGDDEEIAIFETGLEAGIYDAGVFSAPVTKEATHLFLYLSIETLAPKPAPE